MEVDVKDLKIEQLNFTTSYTKDRRTRGSYLFNNEQVYINYVDKISNLKYKVNATVNGSYYNEYDVGLEIEDGMIYNWECTCKDYQKGYICKHIIATSMEVVMPHRASSEAGKKKELLEKQKLLEQQRKEEEKKREYVRKYGEALYTLNRFKTDNSSFMLNNEPEKTINLMELYEGTSKFLLKPTKEIDLKTDIKIEPRIKLSYNNNFDISFKVGDKQKYILKDIVDFYDAFIKKENISLGKNLTFLATKDSFCSEDIPILDYILEYARSIKRSNSLLNENYYYRSKISTKTIRLKIDEIDEFFDIIKNKKISIEDNIYEFSNQNPNIHINVKKQDNDVLFQLNYKYDNLIISTKNIYILNRNMIHIMEKTERIDNLFEVFRKSNEILVPEDRMQDFSTYVLPKISSFIPAMLLSNSENNKEALVVNELATKILLDVDDDGNIILQPKFCYLGKEFSILDKNHEKYVQDNGIVRNIPEERKVVKRLFLDGFEYKPNRNSFIMKNVDYIYEFLSNKINGYMSDFEVMVTDKFKNKKVRQPKISNVAVKIDVGLLKIDISKIDIDISEIKDVLKNYTIKKKYYKLKNGDFLDLENNENLEFLNDISNTFDINYDKISNGVIKLPVNRSIYLEKLLSKNEEIKTTKNDEFTKLINNIENKNFSDDVKVTTKFENVLRDYQKTGYQWMKVLEKYNFGGILADDMGLGKTLQVISLLNDELQAENKKTSIVVSPSSLVLNWKAEVEKWCSDLKVLIVKGDSATRKELIDSYEKYDLIITSYDLLKRDIFEYEGKKFKYIIADEAQYIKNSSTQNATALKSLEGETRFALTGTPIENSISELWSIFDFIMPSYLYNYNKFKKKFEEPILKNEDEKAMRRLKLMITPFILRRLKKDVLTELPDKNITIMKNEMTPEQCKVYNSYLLQTQKEVAKELNDNGFEKSKFKILMLLTRLRQVCCHPSLFIEDYKGGSGKLEQCMDIILDAIEANHKILLFSSYTSMFDIIEKKLIKNNIEYFKLTGSTDVSKRVEMVDDFNNKEEIKVFLISLKAGGTGLNLTGADVVIHYDPWWNLSAENQATDRAYRIGQKNSVQVYKLITTNSIEEKINKLQEKKAEISEEMLSTETTFINKLSKDELMDLFE